MVKKNKSPETKVGDKRSCSSCSSKSSSSIDRSKSPSKCKVTKIAVEYLCPPTKSSSDNNEYRLIRLPNGIRALLISDGGKQCKRCCYHREPNTKRSCQARHVAIPKESFSIEKRSSKRHQPVSIRKQFPGSIFLRGLSNNVISPKISKGSYEYLNEFLNIESSTNITIRAKNPNAPQKFPDSAFSMTVNVGNSSDPATHHGLAHFCEHMLFMGSTKYPVQESFMNFLSYKGTVFNATTEPMNTSYFFSLNGDHNCLDEGINRFSSLIKNPLFNIDSVRREVEAVDNEFCLRKYSDFVAWFLLLSATVKKGHPLGGFGCGNITTLLHPNDPKGLPKLQQELTSFHNKFYVGSAITLAVQSWYSLDQLEELVVQNFSDIKPGAQNIRMNTKIPANLRNPYDTPNFKKMYFIEAKDNPNTMILSWPLPPSTWQDYKKKSIEFILALMNDKTESGLESILRKRGWINNMQTVCPPYDFFRNEYTTLWTMAFSLTNAGFNCIAEIIVTVYSYIRMIINTPLEEKARLWNELGKSANNDFDYTGAGEPLDLVSRSSKLLQIVPGEDIFVADSGIGCKVCCYDNDAVISYLKMIDPKRMNISVFCKSLPSTTNMCEAEEFTKTRFIRFPIRPEWMTRFMNANPLITLQGIPKNPYYPNGRRIRSISAVDPQIVEYTSKFLIIHNGHKGNPVYKANCDVLLLNGNIKWSRIQAVKFDLLEVIFSRLMTPTVDAIERSGMDFQMFKDRAMLGLSFRGFFMDTICLAIEDTFKPIWGVNAKPISEDLFNEVKLQLLQFYRETVCNGDDYIMDLLHEVVFVEQQSTKNDINILQDISYENFACFLELYRKSTYAVILVDGNASIYDCECLAEEFRKLNYTGGSNWLEALKNPNFFRFPTGRSIRTKCDEGFNKNSIVLNLYRLTPDNEFKNFDGIIKFLENFMPDRYFYLLRTEQQLGYSLKLSVSSSIIIMILTFPSSKRPLCEVDEKMDQFLFNFYHRYLKPLSPGEFRELKRLWVLPPSLQQEDITKWYEQIILKQLCLDGNGQNISWNRDLDIVSKLSIQVSGASKENCLTRPFCKNAVWTQGGCELIQFAKLDGHRTNCKPSYFVHDIQEFKKSS